MMPQVTPRSAEQPTAESAKGGDIVSKYPHLVYPFALFQILGWSFCLAEAFGAVGPVGYTIMDGTYPVDIAFCQLMFWGTLHFGPIDDSRLANICRAAFCIEALVLLVSCVTVFRPNAVADALSNGNVTSLFGMEFHGLPRMFLGYIEAAWWFVVFVPFAAWIGSAALMVGRRRLVMHVPPTKLAAFSTRFIRRYILIFAVQGTLWMWSVVNTLRADTVEAQIMAGKINYVLRAVSLVFSMMPGVHAIIFTCAGVSHAQLISGKAPRATKLACVFVVLYIVVVAFDFALVFSAKNSTDPLLNIHSVIELFGLENVPMMGLWLCASYQFGLKFGHLLGKFEQTEARLAAKREQARKSAV